MVPTLHTLTDGEPDSVKFRIIRGRSNGTFQFLESIPRVIIAIQNIDFCYEVTLLFLLCHITKWLLGLVPKMELIAPGIDIPRYLLPYFSAIWCCGIHVVGRLAMREDTDFGDERNIKAASPTVINIL